MKDYFLNKSILIAIKVVNGKLLKNKQFIIVNDCISVMPEKKFSMDTIFFITHIQFSTNIVFYYAHLGVTYKSGNCRTPRIVL